MKRVFRLQGLCCASCAAKMENAISKLDGVNGVTISFMTTRMTLEADDAKMDDIVNAAEKIIRKIEPDVVMKRA